MNVFLIDGKPLKIAALLPLKVDPEKSMLDLAHRDMANTCDEILIMHDNEPIQEPLYNRLVTEEMWLRRGEVWNDFTNRLALMARAATYGCQWVMMLDDDETLGPTLDYDRMHTICQIASHRNATKVVLRVKTAWSDTLYRTDNLFGMQRKTFLLVNPFLLKSFTFEYGPEERLHRFPTIQGAHYWAPHSDFIVHWGMRTRALRERNTAKYEAADPGQKWSPVPYNYLLDESEMTLEPL